MSTDLTQIAVNAVSAIAGGFFTWLGLLTQSSRQGKQSEQSAQAAFRDTLLHQLDKTNERIEELQTELSETKTELASVKSQVQILMHTEAHLKAENSRLAALLEERDAENTHQLERIAELTGKNTLLEQQGVRLRQELDAGLERARQLDDENRDLETHIHQQNARIASLEAELITLRGPMRPAEQGGTA